MPGGAPTGNLNYRKGRLFRQAIDRAMKRKHGGMMEGLEKLAEKLVEDALGGDKPAANIIIERVDGKVAQEITGAGGGPLQVLALTPRILAELTEDELAALERALPALERLGASRTTEGGEGQEGAAEEA